MPKLDEGSILVETRKLPSVSLPESVEISTRVERVLRRFPEVRQVVTKIGRPDLATEAMGIYQGDVYVLLHPSDTWASGRTKEELIDAMATRLVGDARRGVQLHAAHGDAAGRGGVGREGRRGGEGVRARRGHARAAGRAGAPGAGGRAGARPTSRSRCCRGPPQMEIVVGPRAAWRATASTSRTCGSWWRPRSAAAPRRRSSTAPAASTWSCGFPDEIRADRRGHRRPAADRAGRRARRARQRGHGGGGAGAGGHDARERRAAPGRAGQRARAGRRQLRGRGAGPPRRRRGACPGLSPGVGRPVREPAARHAAARAGHPAVARDHLPAAVRDLRQRPAGGAGHPQRAVRAGRRHRRRCGCGA